MNDIGARLSDLERKIQLLENRLRYVIMPSQQSEATVETTTTATVGFNHITDNASSAALPIMQNYGYWSVPLTGALHTLVHVGGLSGRGISIASSDERYRPVNMLPGDVCVSDNTGQRMWITAGNINITCNGTVNLTATDKVQITCPEVAMSGNLTVQGDIIDQARSSNPNNMHAMRTLYDAHTHGNVQTGSGRTSAPDHQE